MLSEEEKDKDNKDEFNNNLLKYVCTYYNLEILRSSFYIKCDLLLPGPHKPCVQSTQVKLLSDT